MKIVVFITAKDKEEARKIAAVLLKEKLAACVNIVDNIESHYWWQGVLEQSSEALMIAKTTKKLFPALTRAVKKSHSYDCPEIIALPIVAGSKAYLDWIDDSVRKGSR